MEYSLSLYVIRAQSVQIFKCHLDKHWECQAIIDRNQ